MYFDKATGFPLFLFWFIRQGQYRILLGSVKKLSFYAIKETSE